MESSSIHGNVYLLHYSAKVRGKQHYVGFTQKEVQIRICEHNTGLGSQISNNAMKIGIQAVLVKKWEGVSVDFEKQLKREKNLKRHCFICNGGVGPVPPKAG